MLLTLQKPDSIYKLALPVQVEGEQWLYLDETDKSSQSILCIKAVDDKWQLNCTANIELVSLDIDHIDEQANVNANARASTKVTLHNKNFAFFEIRQAKVDLASDPGYSTLGKLTIECLDHNLRHFNKTRFENNSVVHLGSDANNTFVYVRPGISWRQLDLSFNAGRWSVIVFDSHAEVYLNGRAIVRNRHIDLAFGDAIEVMGLKIIALASILAYNNPENKLETKIDVNQTDDSAIAAQTTSNNASSTTTAKNSECAPYEEKPIDYFYRSPRVSDEILVTTFEIKDPPKKETSQEMPVILKIGPSIGMAMASVMMGLYMLLNIASGSGSPLRALPMLSMMVVMILGACLWPTLSRRYEKNKARAKEDTRLFGYGRYLDKIRYKILAEQRAQTQILNDNRISPQECIARLDAKDRRLFERTTLHSDFLELRLGRGDIPIFANIKFPREDLQIEEDILKTHVDELATRPNMLKNVPVTISLVDDYVIGILAPNSLAQELIRSFIIQICTLHHPSDVKLVYIADETTCSNWQYIRAIPHIFTDSFDTRFLATKESDVANVTLYLERELSQRQSVKEATPKNNVPYYVVIVDSNTLSQTSELLDKLNSQTKNYGFSTITVAERLNELPKECKKIIETNQTDALQGLQVADKKNEILAQLIPSSKNAGDTYSSQDRVITIKGNKSIAFASQELGVPSDVEMPNDAIFIYDPREIKESIQLIHKDITVDNASIYAFARALIAIDVDRGKRQHSLPTTLGFLELFEVGNVGALDIASRWTRSNPSRSLATPIGRDAYNNLSMLDIHEATHGPHGLVAGMTGSGKSEVLITYILSMAINYRPDEVSFVLIDYKGGGLVGAFDTEEVRLPHLAGTITNLDGASIKRSLTSITSELKARQDLFNQARLHTDESVIDIYKYQTLYRQGKVKRPCPHLIIIADEFAELKANEPEFMDELISAARIGRSLGVHLILATQKPSGVVNDQIWSNARFKICLKVADVSDSREMLKRADAADILETGRYYLQVGHNEYFTQGQCAYSGFGYTPSAKFEHRQDITSIVINNTGQSIASFKPAPKPTSSLGSEALAALKHIAQEAKRLKLCAPHLWVKQLQDHITLDEALETYPVAGDVQTNAIKLNPVVGVVDDPTIQSQELFMLPITDAGNTIIYGAQTSGIATFLNTLLFSLVSSHDASQLNIYILDFESETLNVFSQAPQVGDVLALGDADKVIRLFDMLKRELASRKKLLASANMSFSSYNAHIEEHQYLANIIVLLSGTAAFYEAYPTLEEALIALSRECVRYGIYFILTADNASTLRLRLRNNFKYKLSLELNDQTDYYNLFGSFKNVAAPSIYGRGLIKRERVLEFQTVNVNTVEQEELLKLDERLYGLFGDKANIPKFFAPKIPLVPAWVSKEMLLAKVNGANLGKTKANRAGSSNANPSSPKENPYPPIPIGLFEKDLEPVYIDFEESRFCRILFQRSKDAKELVCALIDLLATVDEYSYAYDSIIIDTGETIIDTDNASTNAIVDIDEAVKFIKTLDKRKTNTGKRSASGKPKKQQKTTLIVLANSQDLLGRAIADANIIRNYLQDINRSERVAIILLDSSLDVGRQAGERWFREHVGSARGFWLGEGFTTSSGFNVTNVFTSQLDVTIKNDRGYFIENSQVEQVKFLSTKTNGVI